VTYSKSRVYQGARNNLFVTEFLLNNTESRSVIPSNLNGYILNSKGEMLNLEFEKVEENILPGEHLALLGSVVVPKSFDTKNVEIHIGEQLVIDEQDSIMLNPV